MLDQLNTSCGLGVAESCITIIYTAQSTKEYVCNVVVHCILLYCVLDAFIPL